MMGTRKAPQTDTHTPDLLSATEVAGRLGVSDDHARNLMRGGHLGPMVDLSIGEGRPAWRVYAEAVTAFVTSRTTARG